MREFRFNRKEKIDGVNANGTNRTVTFLALWPDVEKYERNVGTVHDGRLMSNWSVKRIPILRFFKVWRVTLSFFTPYDLTALGMDGTWPGYLDGEDVG